jgi:hypothetical protein
MTVPALDRSGPRGTSQGASIERLWIVAGLVLLAGIVWHAMAILGDGFWCLAAGDHVLRTGALPDFDPFSFASRQVPWVLHMPAFQIGGAWLVAHAGLRAFMVASAIPIVAAAALLWLLPAHGPLARLVAFPVALLYVLVDQEDISARGQAFGDLGFAVLLLLIARIRTGGRVRPWWPLLLGAAWANFHPSFLLAVAVPLAVALADGLARASLGPLGRMSSLPLQTGRRLVAFAALSLVGACLNPSSVVLVVDVLKLLVDPTTSHVDLFQSPDFQSPGWLVPMALAVVLLVWLACQGASMRRRGDAMLLLLLVGALCLARRYATILVAFELVLVGQAANSMRASAPAWLPVALVSSGVLQMALGLRWLAERKDPLHDVPVQAVASIERLDAPDRVLNPYHWGGYLDWVWHGDRKVFIDGRNQLFSNGVFDDSERLDALLPGARELLDIYEIRTVLWERGAPLDQALAQAPDWRLVHSDPMAVVYVRR